MANTQKALLIIDMQKGSFNGSSPRLDTDGVVFRINALAAIFRKKNLPVIFIQHDGTGSGDFEKNTTSWELLDELDVYASDILFDKYANDVFYESGFQSKLNELGVGELYITGCATEFCVESSIQSALVKDYDITVVSDGHTTADRPHLDAEKIIVHYNWVWQDMVPTKGRIEVKPFDEIVVGFWP
jgi:nicotinamidase-related amidase